MSKKNELLKYTSKDGQEIVFPVVTINGKKEGRHAVITAGIHGAEYPPIAAALELVNEINPLDVNGTITIVTCSCISAFEGRSMFVNPNDKKNPNHSFPGKEDGSYTEALIYYLFRDVISKSSLHLELHCGDMIESLVSFVEYPRGVNPEIDRECREIAEYYGAQHGVGCKVRPEAGLCYQHSALHGIPAALCEYGGHGLTDRESIDLTKSGVINVLRHFGIIDGDAEKKEVEFFNKFMSIHVAAPGFFYCDIKPGDYIKKGQIVGHTVDYLGNHVADTLAPHDGKIMYITDNPAMFDDLFLSDFATNIKE